MPQFEAYAPHIEVRGEVVLTMLEAMGFFKKMGVKILKQYGILAPAPQKWYSQQAYLNAHKEIYQQVGVKTLKAIGKKIPEMALWPDNIHTLEQALASIDEAYQMNHRGGKIGFYRFEKIGDHSGNVLCHNPYPCPFDHGIIEAIAHKFSDEPVRIRVIHNPAEGCRMKGGDICTYHVFW